MKAMFRLMRICLSFFAGAIAPVAVLAFPCETDFGTIEIPELPGYVHARESVVKGIQKNKESGGARDKLLFVLVREEEADKQGGFTDLLQFSHIPCGKVFTDKEFESFAAKINNQFPESMAGLAKNAIRGPSHNEKDIFSESIDIPMGETFATGTFRMVSGGLRIRGRLVSFLFMLTNPTQEKIQRLKRFLRDIRDANEQSRQTETKSPVRAASANDVIARISHSEVVDLLREPTTRLRTLGMEKADGLDIQIDYPQSMEAKAGRQPHMVQTFRKHVGPYNFMVQIMVQPIAGEESAAFFHAAHLKDSGQIEEFSKLWAKQYGATPAVELLDFGNTTMSGINTFWCLARNKAERLGVKVEQLVKSYTIPAVKGKLLQISFSISSVALDGSAEQPIPPAEFDALNPLVMVILNSLTFMNKSQISNESDALQGVCVGTAWFVSPEHAVTCWHVIEQGSDFFFTDFDGRKIQLSLVAKDEFSDLAVLRVINPKDASSNWLSLASGLPQVSDTVFTVGFPHPNLLGQQPKYTEGTITALSGLGDNQAYLQTTTPMQRGNSGGPLVNEAGEVVGIAAIKTMTLDEIADEKLQNVNFAVKVEKLVALLEKVGVTAAPPIGIKPISRRELFAEVRDAVILLQVR